MNREPMEPLLLISARRMADTHPHRHIRIVSGSGTTVGNFIAELNEWVSELLENAFEDGLGEGRNEVERERDAYRKAKQENDERFQLQAAEQRERAEAAEAERDEWEENRDEMVRVWTRRRDEQRKRAERAEHALRICREVSENRRALRAEAEAAPQRCRDLAEEWESYAPSSWDEPAQELRAAIDGNQ